jgi:hypothetical protein
MAAPTTAEEGDDRRIPGISVSAKRTFNEPYIEYLRRDYAQEFPPPGVAKWSDVFPYRRPNSVTCHPTSSGSEIKKEIVALLDENGWSGQEIVSAIGRAEEVCVAGSALLWAALAVENGKREEWTPTDIDIWVGHTRQHRASFYAISPTDETQAEFEARLIAAAADDLADRRPPGWPAGTILDHFVGDDSPLPREVRENGVFSEKYPMGGGTADEFPRTVTFELPSTAARASSNGIKLHFLLRDSESPAEHFDFDIVRGEWSGGDTAALSEEMQECMRKRTVQADDIPPLLAAGAKEVVRP